MSEPYLTQLDEHVEVMNLARSLSAEVEALGQQWCDALKNGRKILLMGNGGSASDAQHIAAELVGRYLCERDGLPAIALTTDTSILTAVGNDYGYGVVFSRQIEALCQSGDVVVGYSTSGNSENVCRAMQLAREKGAYTAALTGDSGGRLLALTDCCLRVPSSSTPRIQETHAFIGHVLCGMVDNAFT